MSVIAGKAQVQRRRARVVQALSTAGAVAGGAVANGAVAGGAPRCAVQGRSCGAEVVSIVVKIFAVVVRRAVLVVRSGTTRYCYVVPTKYY